MPLRPNAVANRSSVSLGVCPSVGPEIISIHRIMIYWELRRMWEGREDPLICWVLFVVFVLSLGQLSRQILMTKFWLISSLKILKILVNMGRGQE